MATFSIQGSDGKTYTVEAPEGTSESLLKKYVERRISKTQTQVQPQTQPQTQTQVQTKEKEVWTPTKKGPANWQRKRRSRASIKLKTAIE